MSMNPGLRLRFEIMFVSVAVPVVLAVVVTALTAHGIVAPRLDDIGTGPH